MPDGASTANRVFKTLHPKLFLTLAPGLLCLITAGITLWDFQVPKPPPEGGAFIMVQDGDAFHQIANILFEAGVVRSSFSFRALGWFTGKDRKLNPGDYWFKKPARPIEVLRTLTSDSGLHDIVLPEGITALGVASALEREGFGPTDQFLCLGTDGGFLAAKGLPGTGLEGYLFPARYRFPWGKGPAEILGSMVERTRHELKGLRCRGAGCELSDHQIVTLASIIEKETGRPEERALISGVFHRRLRIGMRLQADPTVMYGRAVDKAPNPEDLGVDSPYNTYLHSGLPPGPICNPGRDTLRAAVSPEGHGFLYFVARGDGAHVFASTLEEHNANVRLLRAKQRSLH